MIFFCSGIDHYCSSLESCFYVPFRSASFFVGTTVGYQEAVR